MWYSPSANQGWGAKSLSRKQSMADTELSQGPPLKPSAGRVIRIVNYMDHSVQVIGSINLKHLHTRTEAENDLTPIFIYDLNVVCALP